jgi:hypothetical protein
MSRKEEICVLLKEDEQVDLETVVSAVLEDVEHFDKDFFPCPRL